MSLKQSYNGIPAIEIKAFLEEKFLQYNNPSFIDSDPISILTASWKIVTGRFLVFLLQQLHGVEGILF